MNETIVYDNKVYTLYQQPHLDINTGKEQAVVADSDNKPHIAYFKDDDVVSIIPIKGFTTIDEVLSFFSMA